MKHALLFAVSLLLFGSPASAADPEPVFEDRFDGKLTEGWTWLRENSEAWRIRENALEIRVQPGDAGTVRNALLRKAPDRSQGKFAIDVTVSNHTVPTQQYEQAGITWYNKGRPVFKLVKERVDGQLMIIPGRKPMTNEMVQLRLIVTHDSWTAQFRPLPVPASSAPRPSPLAPSQSPPAPQPSGDFQTADQGKLPPPGDDQVSLQCYHGPPDAEHWIRFDNFRIVKLAD